MEMQLVTEQWPGVISTVKIGAVRSQGGTRAKVIEIGGQNSLPFLFEEGSTPYKPVIAFEVWDIPPVDWPGGLMEIFGNQARDPLAWAQACVNDFKAQALCVKLQGAHPDSGDKSPEDAAQFIAELLKKVNVPLIICGCGDDQKDNSVLPLVSEAARGERCLIGPALQDNYKTLAASVLADGHNLIAESPIDINIAKQLNILISDMGLGLERIVINPTIGALGYGLEYAYSIMERARLAALSGDKTLAMPFICFVGQESWKTKEAKESLEHGIIWETITATALLQAGADILVMRHPKAVEKTGNFIDQLFAGNKRQACL